MSKRPWIVASIALALGAAWLICHDGSAWSYAVGYGKYRLGLSGRSDPHVTIDVPLADQAFIRHRAQGMELVGSEPSAWIVIRDRRGKTVDDFSVGLIRRNVPIFFDGLPSGDYEIVGRLPNSVSWSRWVHFDTRFPQHVSPNWRLGDVDGDDRITERDAAEVRQNLGKVVAARHRFKFTAMLASNVDLREGMDRVKNSDLDGDGYVDQRDLELVLWNKGRSGEANLPWSQFFAGSITGPGGVSVSSLRP